MNFYQNVYRLVKRIPRGRVATYAQIASFISTPRSAQVVGFALKALGDRHTDVPWQRVINSQGRISIQNLRHAKSEQARLLKKEGVKVIERDNAFLIDLEKYLWRPTRRDRHL